MLRAKIKNLYLKIQDCNNLQHDAFSIKKIYLQQQCIFKSANGIFISTIHFQL